MGQIIEDARLRIINEKIKGIDAIRTLKNICENQYDEDCHSGRCPIADWCHNDKNEYPCDWID